MATTTTTTRRIITGKVRFSYLNAFTPRAITEGATPKYSVSLIIDKNDEKTITAIHQAVDAALKDGASKFPGGKIPNKTQLRLPLRDGDLDRPDDPAYAGCWFLNASSTHKPQVVDASVQPILDPDELYSGCYGRASLEFFAYNTSGNRGVGVGLGNLQKLADGEPLGGGRTAEQDFGAPAADDGGDLLT